MNGHIQILRHSLLTLQHTSCGIFQCAYNKRQKMQHDEFFHRKGSYNNLTWKGYYAPSRDDCTLITVDRGIQPFLRAPSHGGIICIASAQFQMWHHVLASFLCHMDKIANIIYVQNLMKQNDVEFCFDVQSTSPFTWSKIM